ncbi:MAG: glycosyltransferase [Pseudomonadota bacterium]
MKIGLQTWGSEGDVRPMVALSAGLHEAGHEVTLGISSSDNKDYSHYAKKFGFSISKVGHLIIDHDKMKHLVLKASKTNNIMKHLSIIWEAIYDPFLKDMTEFSKALCQKNDLLIGHFTVHPLKNAAELFQKKHVSVGLNYNAIPTKFIPPSGMPNLGKFFNPFLWKTAEILTSIYFSKRFNELRLQEGLKPINKMLPDAFSSNTLNLLAISSLLCEKQSDWSDHHKICGFFNMPIEGEDKALPDGLEEFLNAGEKPIYITFGSMMGVSVEYAEETTKILIEAIKKAGVRAILQSEWDQLNYKTDDKNIYPVTSANHQSIFPKCSLIIHHGGAGTTQSSVLASVPSIVVPHVLDQFFWAKELKRIHVSKGSINRKNLTSQKLAILIQMSLESKELEINAVKAAEIMRNENGVKRAIDLIEQLN